MGRDDTLRELVDDEEHAQGATLARANHHEVPRPHMVGPGGLAQVRASGASAAPDAWPGRRELQCRQAAYPSDLAQADAVAELAHVAHDFAVAVGREGDGVVVNTPLKVRLRWNNEARLFHFLIRTMIDHCDLKSHGELCFG